jgi:hypothetical protein
VIQKSGRGGGDLLPAVLIGALGSCLATIVPSLPFTATGSDLALLGLLGVAQLAIPCLIAVAAARYLSAPEAALLSLLEIVFGVTWTWLGAGEEPGRHVLIGGALVIAALVANEALALRRGSLSTIDVPATARIGVLLCRPQSSRYHAARYLRPQPPARQANNRTTSLVPGPCRAARRPSATESSDARRLPLAAPPRGDGHPVMVFPGLAERHHLAVARLLRSLGYVTQAGARASMPGRGSACSIAAPPTSAPGRSHRPAGQPARLEPGRHLRPRDGQGRPELTRVITLGAFTGHPRHQRQRIYEWLSGSPVGDPDVMAQVRVAPPVPTTSIFSRSDGIVAWRCSLNEPGPLAENVEVPASHVGMGMNPTALYAIAARLAQPIGQWKPFEVSGARRWFFRTGTPETIAAVAAR